MDVAVGIFLLVTLVAFWFTSRSRRREPSVEGYDIDKMWATGAHGGSETEPLASVQAAPLLVAIDPALLDRGFDRVAFLRGKSPDSPDIAVYANNNFAVYLSVVIRGGRASLELMSQCHDGAILLSSSTPPPWAVSNSWLSHIQAPLEYGMNENPPAFATGGDLDKSLEAHVRALAERHPRGYSPYYTNLLNYCACRDYLTGLYQAAAAAEGAPPSKV